MKNNCSGDGSTDRSCAFFLRVGGASRPRELRNTRFLARTTSFLLLLLTLNSYAVTEETFAVLKVGNHTYQNVTVTTKGKNFIIIVHSGGIASIKTDLLPVTVLKRLGYLPPSAPKKKSTGPKLLAQRESTVRVRS
jgi:hypothetical protein